MDKVSGTQGWVLKWGGWLLTGSWFAGSRVVGGSGGMAAVFVQDEPVKWNNVRWAALNNRLNAVPRNIISVAEILPPR